MKHPIILAAVVTAITISACAHSFARDPFDPANDEAMPAATSGALFDFSEGIIAAKRKEDGDSGYLLLDRNDAALHWF